MEPIFQKNGNIGFNEFLINLTPTIVTKTGLKA
jgi:hypothetical protein